MKGDLLKQNKNLDTNYSLFKRNIEKVFDDFFSFKPSSLFESKWLPTIDVEEEDKLIRVKAEIPGIDEKNLDITLEQNSLTISGEKKEEKKEEDKNKRYLFSERKFGSFRRTLNLPEGIKADKIKANFKNGVLSIEIPKEESVKPQKIQIDVK